MWYFFRGYVKIRFRGLKLCQWLQALTAAGIVLHSAEREAYTVMTAQVSLRDYREIKKLAQEHAISLEELARGGLPVLLARLLRRQGLFWGALLCAGLLLYAGGYIFIVRVDVENAALQQRIGDFLSEAGVRQGVSQKELDTLSLQRKVLLEFDELAFFTLERRGVILTARGILKTPQTAISDPTVPTAVYAAKAGIITKVIPLQGEAKVSPGQTVQPGDVLISGYMPLGEENYRTVHAKGEVWARIGYAAEASAPAVGITYTLTGRRQYTGFIELAGLHLGQAETGCEYTLYRLTEKRTPIGVLNGPKRVSRMYEELSAQEISLPLRTLMEETGQAALQAALAQTPQGSVPAQKTITYYMDADNRLWARARVDVLEDIAREAPLFSGGN